MNVVILIGNVGKDAEVRQTQAGKDMMRFSLAVNERWVDANGVKQEKANWFNCVMWGDRSAKLAPHVTQGLKVGVRGRLETRTVEKDGAKITYTDVVVDDVTFLSPKKDAASDDDQRQESRGRSSAASAAPKTSSKPAGAAKSTKATSEPVDDSDIPF